MKHYIKLRIFDLVVFSKLKSNLDSKTCKCFLVYASVPVFWGYYS